MLKLIIVALASGMTGFLLAAIVIKNRNLTMQHGQEICEFDQEQQWP